MKKLLFFTLSLVACHCLQGEEKTPANIDPQQFKTITDLINPLQLACGGSSLPVTGTHLFTFNDLGSGGNTQYPTGTDIPFNGGPDVIGGTGLSHPSDDTILITKTGRYLVTFMGSTYANGANSVGDLIDPDFTAQTQFTLNGVPLGAALEVNIRGSMVVNQAIISVPTVPSNLTVRVVNDTLWLNDVNSASLVVVRISNQQ